MSGIIKGKKIVLNTWQNLFEKEKCPEGYSTAFQISEKLGVPESTTRCKLKRLRISGKVECMQFKNEHGNDVWVYKD